MNSADVRRSRKFSGAYKSLNDARIKGPTDFLGE